MKRAAFVMAAGWLLSPIVASAQATVSIRTEAAPREIYIGDPIQMRVTVDFSSSVAASPLLVSVDTSTIELIGIQSAEPKPARKDMFEIVHTIALTSFSTGQFTIPAFPLMFKAPD